MANNKFQVKRTSTSGLLPNTTNSSNTSYIDAGELAINLTDKKMVSSNGSVSFEIGANLTSLNVSTNTVTIGTAAYHVANGNFGVGTSTPGYKLEVNGSFAATTKSFVIPHPTKPDMKLRYGSLEGPENGVYVRGKSNSSIIDLPDYWCALIDEDTITVNLTPIGKAQSLFVETVNSSIVTVKNGNMFNNGVNYYYTIFAERKDVDKLKVEI